MKNKSTIILIFTAVVLAVVAYFVLNKEQGGRKAMSDFAVKNIEDIDNYQPATEEEETLLDVDYAILNVYRYGGRGSLMSYDLYLGDSILCRVRNNFKTTLRIKKDGLNSLWAKTEKKAEVSIDVEIGKTYYLRCGVSIGVLVGRPQLELIDGKTGKTEFETFEAKNQ